MDSSSSVPLDPAVEVEIRPGRHIHVFTSFAASSTDTNSDTTTLLFLHGSMATYTQFGDLIAPLREHCHIVAYDAAGCGASRKVRGAPEHYAPHNLLMDAVAVLDRYCGGTDSGTGTGTGTGRVVVVGHSFGTALAMRLLNHVTHRHKDAAADPTAGPNPVHPSRIRGLVLLGGGRSVSAKSFLWHLPVFVLDWLHPTLSAGFADLAFSPSTGAELRQRCLSVSSSNDMEVCKAFYSQFSWCDDEEWEGHARHHEFCVSSTETDAASTAAPCPLLMLSGRDDKIVPLANSEELHGLLLRSHGKGGASSAKGGDGGISVGDVMLDTDGGGTAPAPAPAPAHVSHVVVDAAGHQLMQEQPAVVLGHLKEFLGLQH